MVISNAGSEPSLISPKWLNAFIKKVKGVKAAKARHKNKITLLAISDSFTEFFFVHIRFILPASGKSKSFLHEEDNTVYLECQ